MTHAIFEYEKLMRYMGDLPVFDEAHYKKIGLSSAYKGFTDTNAYANSIIKYNNDLYICLKNTRKFPNEEPSSYIQLTKNNEVKSLQQEVEKLKEENGHILELLETTFGNMSGTLGKITSKLPTQGGTRRLKKKGRKTLRRHSRN